MKVWGIMAAIAAAAGLAGAAMAQDNLSAFTTNTAKATYADGSVIEWLLNDDGSFSNSAGQTGAYAYDGAQMCFTADGSGEEACSDFNDVPRSPGDVWTTTLSDGSEVTIELVEGR